MEEADWLKITVEVRGRTKTRTQISEEFIQIYFCLQALSYLPTPPPSWAY